MDADKRLAQLNKVFLKALDVSVEAVGPEDIREAFQGPVLEGVGANALQAAVIKQLGRLRSSLETQFTENCDRNDVLGIIKAAAAAPANQSSSGTNNQQEEEEEDSVALEQRIRDMEKQRLVEAIAALRARNASLGQEVQQGVGAARDQVASLGLEARKAEAAAEQFQQS